MTNQHDSDNDGEGEDTDVSVISSNDAKSFMTGLRQFFGQSKMDENDNDCLTLHRPIFKNVQPFHCNIICSFIC